MPRRNSNKKMKNKKVMSSNQKLKSDFINYYDYMDLFHESYSIIDKECRENLKKWNEVFATMDLNVLYDNDEL